MDNIIFEGNYFRIEKKILPNRKTPIYEIINGNIKIGEVKWYGAWRKYCFFPTSDTVWDGKCLNELNDFLSNIKVYDPE